MTGDVVFFLSSSPTNEAALRSVLEKFGFGTVLPSKERRLFAKKVLMLGKPPYRIDLISEIDGVVFDEAWSRKERGMLDGLPVWFISLSDLLANKRAAARDKDIADAKILARLLAKELTN